MIAGEIQHKNCKEKHDGSSLLIRNVEWHRNDIEYIF